MFPEVRNELKIAYDKQHQGKDSKSLSTEVREPNGQENTIEEDDDMPVVPLEFIYGMMDDEKSKEDAKEINVKIEEECKSKPMTEEEKAERRQQLYEEKRYYLSGLRMKENFEKSELSQGLSPEIRKRISDAYLCCTDPNELNDPNFLDGRLSKYFEEHNINFELVGIHMCILTNTFVGYKIEGSGSEKNEEQEKSADNVKEMKLLQMPQLLDGIPETLKEYIKTQGKRFITNRIQDVLNGSNTLEAIAVIANFPEFIRETLGMFADTLGDSKEESIAKIFLKEEEKAKELMGSDEMGIKRDLGVEDLTIKIDDSVKNNTVQLKEFANQIREVKKSSGETKSPLENSTLEFVIDDEEIANGDFFELMNTLMENGCTINFIIAVENEENRDRIEENIKSSCQGNYNVFTGEPDVFNKAMKETTDNALNPVKDIEQVIEAVDEALEFNVEMNPVLYNVVNAAFGANMSIDETIKWVATLQEEHENEEMNPDRNTYTYTS